MANGALQGKLPKDLEKVRLNKNERTNKTRLTLMLLRLLLFL